MIDIFRLLFGLICYIITLLFSFIPYINYIILHLLARINNYIFGFHKTIVKDYRKFKHDTKILIFQHNSYYDLYLLGQHFKPKNITGMIDSNMLKIPIMKNLFKTFEMISVNKADKNNSQKLIDYLNNANNTKYLGIASAGNKATKEDRIGNFKTGAFVPMKPVTPVLIRYKDDKGSWFFKDNLKDWFLDIFKMRKFYTCELIILEEITAEGCSTPREYADKVEKYMKLNSQMLPPMT